MEGKEIQNGDSAKSGESKSSEDLEKALQTFINKADQQKPQTKSRYGKIKSYFSQPKNVLEVAGVVILLIYTVFTIGLWRAQQTGNGINQKALIDANRPWIKIVSISLRNIWWMPGNPSKGIQPVLEISPRIWITNVGHSPAINIFTDIQAVIVESWPQPVANLQEKSCVRAGGFSNNQSQIGKTLFQGDTVDAEQGDFPVLWSGITLPESDVMKYGTNLPSGAKGFNFVIYGCLDYEFGTPGKDTTHFQTVFGYEVWRLTLDTTGRVSRGQFLNMQNVPASDISLTENYNSNNNR